MHKLDKPSSAETPLLLTIGPEPSPEILTALGGIQLLVQAFRSLAPPAGWCIMLARSCCARRPTESSWRNGAKP